jgi:hypothetical protein
MGWCTEFHSKVHFNKQTYNSKDSLEQELEEAKEGLESLKRKLVALVASNPKDLITKDCEGVEFDTIESITQRVDNWLEMYDEYYTDLLKYEDALEYFHLRSGDFVKPDMYAKFYQDTDSIFVKDAVYEVNTKKDWQDITNYYVNIGDTFIKFPEDKFNSLFMPSTEDAYTAYLESKYAAEVEAYRIRREAELKEGQDEKAS